VRGIVRRASCCCCCRCCRCVCVCVCVCFFSLSGHSCFGGFGNVLFWVLFVCVLVVSSGSFASSSSASLEEFLSVLLIRRNAPYGWWWWVSSCTPNVSSNSPAVEAGAVVDGGEVRWLVSCIPIEQEAAELVSFFLFLRCKVSRVFQLEFPSFVWVFCRSQEWWVIGKECTLR
jgi:hypothetical protein